MQVKAHSPLRERSESNAIILSQILKKKNKFGFYFKRLLSLSEEPRLGYTNEGDNKFKKLIDLGEETKLTRMN